MIENKTSEGQSNAVITTGRNTAAPPQAVNSVFGNKETGNEENEEFKTEMIEIKTLGVLSHAETEQSMIQITTHTMQNPTLHSTTHRSKTKSFCKSISKYNRYFCAVYPYAI